MGEGLHSIYCRRGASGALDMGNIVSKVHGAKSALVASELDVTTDFLCNKAIVSGLAHQ